MMRASKPSWSTAGKGGICVRGDWQELVPSAKFLLWLLCQKWVLQNLQLPQFLTCLLGTRKCLFPSILLFILALLQARAEWRGEKPKPEQQQKNPQHNLHSRVQFAVRIFESIFVQFHLDKIQEFDFSHCFTLYSGWLGKHGLKPMLNHKIQLNTGSKQGGEINGWISPSAAVPMIFLSYPALRELLGSGVVLKSAQAAVSSQHRAENWINSLSLFLSAFLLNSWTAKSSQRMEANLGFNPLLSHYQVEQQSLKQAEISTDSKPGCLRFTYIYNF